MRDLLRRVLITGAVAALVLPAPALANLRSYGLVQPVELGSATLRWLGLAVYRARLHTDGANRFDWNRPLALEIEYFRSITRADLTQSTRSELQRIEGTRPDLEALTRKLDGCFRDVDKGDVFTAVSVRPDSMELYLNGERTCAIRHEGLRKRFLGIWLSENSRSARLSAELRGQ
ncbi:chalcone isomerase family protein [Phaeobacter sp. PT47_59]|uniref:chalcone isomerase family protein n=1 Tax=Phaeobacter sp. PT47_59 TaxID=3029979 RepID=UPI002380C16B|nr:chalcone isomerase family protein [Phaeobacter sp. PT47_59]MDE4173396.1 chalcone isomerase family protein [Phaeobacter sp. PT47_59]